jgi:hypothetical protein
LSRVSISCYSFAGNLEGVEKTFFILYSAIYYNAGVETIRGGQKETAESGEKPGKMTGQ